MRSVGRSFPSNRRTSNSASSGDISEPAPSATAADRSAHLLEEGVPHLLGGRQSQSDDDLAQTLLHRGAVLLGEGLLDLLGGADLGFDQDLPQGPLQEQGAVA